MSRLSLFAITIVLSCRGATPTARDPVEDAAPPFWQRGDAPATDLPTCGETKTLLDYDRRQADVLILFDRSESMTTEFTPGTRYSVVAETLGNLVDVYQDKLRFGFQQFPDAQPCPVGYAAGCCAGPPSVPVALSNAVTIRSAIAAAAPPGGSTPTAEALIRAGDYFAGLEDGITDRYILLSTDGRPSCNTSGRLAEADVFDLDGNRVAGACYDALVEVDRLVAAGVKVIVLGVGSGLQDDPGGQPGCLEEMGRRGRGPLSTPMPGTPPDRPWFFSGTDQDGLELALQQIFGGTVRPSCTLTLKAAPPDPDQVAVFVDGHQVPRNRNYGWDYDSPDATQIIHFFGDYCRRIDRFQIAALEVRYGCPPCGGEGRQCE